MDILEDIFGKYPFAKYYVLFSGGTDSLVALHLSLIESNMQSNMQIRALHVDTTVAFPENLEYVERTCSTLKIPLDIVKAKIDFWTRVQQFAFPTPARRWCTKYMKMFPTRAFLRKHHFAILIDGVRRAESPMRSLRYKEPFTRYWNMKNRYVAHPILEWSDEQVKTYVSDHGLEVNPLYEELGVSGCYFCPFLSRKYYFRLASKRPELFQTIVDAEEQLNNKSSFLCLHGQRIYARDIARWRQSFLSEVPETRETWS